jgi:hypothetical protein
LCVHACSALANQYFNNHGRGAVTIWPSSGEKKDGVKMTGHSLEVQNLPSIPS